MSGRGSGGGRGGPVSSVKKERHHRHRGLLVIRRARAGVSKSGQELHRACAGIRHSGTMSGSTPGTESSPPRQAPVTRCAPSFSSWNFFQYGRLTAVRKPTCQALTQSCGRDRAMTASASAVTLRGIPRRHGEDVESTARPQSASESGTVQISSVTPPRTASGPRRSASIAERESVATGTRLGDWMLLPGGELKTVCGHAQWQDTPHGRSTQGCQQLRGEAPQGARLSGEPSGSAADPDARSAREDEPPTANTVAN
ncbi:thimet oligopeptidase [Trypanosoma cruzi Dm28c]|uniref:Thimet oligopeptidase n=1 Tax=Trypanosoma cruzi Dm28c TaxID=1416333 RepID=V5B7T3_TRYCR|nr:thimet oligopeptidase [Trypanosoma cruzi Dm28c]